MGRFVVELDTDKYVVWSTVVDAPICYIDTLENVKLFWADEHGKLNMEKDFEHFLRPGKQQEYKSRISNYNRAGEGEKMLSIPELIEKYTYKEQDA